MAKDTLYMAKWWWTSLVSLVVYIRMKVASWSWVQWLGMCDTSNINTDKSKREKADIPEYHTIQVR